MNWSFRLFSIPGTEVRIHFLFIFWAGYLLMRTGNNWQAEAIFLGIVFGSVLLHEFGHAFACRWFGGAAPRITLWPLGGLAECDAPHHPWVSFWVTLWGPLVNLIIMGGCVLTMLAIMWLNQIPVIEGFPVTLNPFNIQSDGRKLDAWKSISVKEDMVLIYCISIYFINWMLFLFNMVFCGYPMDGGRLIQSLLWIRFGYVRSTYIATSLSLGVMAVLAWWTYSNDSTIGVAISIFIAMHSWGVRKRMVMIAQQAGGWRAVAEYEKQKGHEPWSSPLKRMLQGQDNLKSNDITDVIEKAKQEGTSALSPEERRALKADPRDRYSTDSRSPPK